MNGFFSIPIRPIEVFVIGVMVVIAAVSLYLIREAKRS
jgi:hypothetical protein